MDAVQFAFIDVQVTLLAAVATGAAGALVLAVMVVEFELVVHPLTARMR